MDAPPIIALNKAEMAKRLKVSLPTMTNWLDRWPDFPVIERGTNGKSWRFDPHAVFDFLAERREEEQSKISGRDEQLERLQLQFDDLFQPKEQPRSLGGVSAKEQIDIWRLRELKRKEAERCGKLVVADQMQDMFSSAFATLSRESGVFLRRLAREQDWPEAVLRKAEADLASMQRKTVNAVLDTLKQEADTDHERQLHLA
ncbi:terminase small subunit [Asaia astilbis]|uniref:terminase small subunit n=1 Tax=Asaia astilbis TaxID=610244 RepID=UPI00046EBBDB|nr:terminase small subunit [Asaia astilbis]